MECSELQLGQVIFWGGQHTTMACIMAKRFLVFVLAMPGDCHFIISFLIASRRSTNVLYDLILPLQYLSHAIPTNARSPAAPG